MHDLDVSEGSHPIRYRKLLERIGWLLMAAWVGTAIFSVHREMVVRAAIVYVALLILFRLAGSRTLANLTSFDMILLLILSEAAQPALTGPENPPLLGALTSVVTLVGLDILTSLAKQRFTRMDAIVDGRPLVLMAHGRPLQDRLDVCRVTLDDVLAAGRVQGLSRLDEINYAVLEANGHLSIIPVAKD